MPKKILILSHKPPYPKLDGGAIAISQLLETLLIENIVTFLSIETDKHPSKSVIEHPMLSYKSVHVNTRTTMYDGIKNLFTNKSYILSRFDSVDYKIELKSILNKTNFDIIVFESLFTSSYLPIVKKLTSAKLIYRSHNIEYQIWERQIKNSPNNFLFNTYLRLQAKRLKKDEIKFWNSVNLIACISVNDQKIIKTHSDVKKDILGIFFKNRNQKIESHSKDIDFFHLGAMDWKPNQDGVQWIYDKVWPIFHEIYPLSTFHIAGKDMPKSFLNNKFHNVINHGEIPDAENFISSHKVMLVPLFSGSGVRVKIIEGLSYGKCIITTKIGLQGIPCTDRKNILIADSIEDFIKAMEFCIKNPEKVRLIEIEAKKIAQKYFSKNLFLNKVKKIFK